MAISGFETNRCGMSNSSHCCIPNGPMMCVGKPRPGAGEGFRNHLGRLRDWVFFPFYRLGSQSVTNRDPCPH